MTRQEERSIEEMANAEVVPEMSGPEQLYVRFGERDYGFVSRTERNQILVETNLLESAADGLVWTLDNGSVVRFEPDFEANEYTVAVDDDERAVPSEYVDDVLSAARNDDGQRIAEVHAQIVATQVQQDVVNQFEERYVNEEARSLAMMEDEEYEPRVRVTRDGWVIDDTFIVQWNAENYLVNDIEVHVRDGNRTVEADESKQARDLSFSAIDGEVTVENPDGDEVTLGEQEQQFLATVETLLYPHQYLDEQGAQDVREMVQLNDDTITVIAASANCNTFTDETDGLHHNHGIQKHRLQDLGVTEEVVERLHHRGDGHSGVHELALREQEFRNADFDVFEDAANTDPDKWEKINNTRENAPIPGRVRRNLNEMFG